MAGRGAVGLVADPRRGYEGVAGVEEVDAVGHAEPEPAGDIGEACRRRGVLGLDGQQTTGRDLGRGSAEDDLVTHDRSTRTVGELPAGQVEGRRAGVRDLDEVGGVAGVLVDRNGRRGCRQCVGAARGRRRGLREGAGAVDGPRIARRRVRVDRQVDVRVDDRSGVGAEQVNLVGLSEAEPGGVLERAREDDGVATGRQNPVEHDVVGTGDAPVVGQVVAGQVDIDRSPVVELDEVGVVVPAVGAELVDDDVAERAGGVGGVGG